MEACRDLCLTAPYRCHSFDYGDTGERVCRLSHHTSTTLTQIQVKYDQRTVKNGVTARYKMWTRISLVSGCGIFWTFQPRVVRCWRRSPVKGCVMCGTFLPIAVELLSRSKYEINCPSQTPNFFKKAFSERRSSSHWWALSASAANITERSFLRSKLSHFANF